MQIIPLPGNFQTKQSYALLNADGGITGTFSHITSSVPSLMEVLYDSTDIEVNVLLIGSLGLYSNAEAAASSYLANGFTPGSDIEEIHAALLALNAAELNDSLNQMQPSQFSGLAWGQIENALLVRSSYFQHLEKVNRLPSRWNQTHVWAEVIGASQKQNSHGQQFGYTDWTHGATVGLDALCCDVFKLGIAATYTQSRLNWHRSAGYANINSYYGGLYASWLNQRGYVHATLLGAHAHYQTDRHLHFSTLDRHAKSSHSGWEGLAGLEAGLYWGFAGSLEMMPFVKMDYIHLSQKGFIEKGADSLDLSVDRKKNQMLQSELGVIWTQRYRYEKAWIPGSLVPLIKLSYMNDTPFSSRHLNASFVNSDQSFTVKGLSFKRNLGAASLGLTYLNNADTMSMGLHYEGQFSSHYYNQAAHLSLDIKF